MDGERYWDEVSDDYENLYSSPWSKYEDRVLSESLLSFAANLAEPRVLDIGCGTGLGYEILREIPKLKYIGLDYSQGMLDKMSTRFPGVRTIRSDVRDMLDHLEGERFDMVIGINVVGSFVRDVPDLLQASSSVLARRGLIYFSFLNRYALRRLVAFKFRNDELYRTRGDQISSEAVLATTYTPKQVKHLFQSAGFEVAQIGCRSVLGGVVETSFAPRIEEVVSKFANCLGHELYAVGQKKG